MPVLKSAIDASPTSDLYQTDYQRWLFDNAALLRTGRLSEIDAANIAEELEDMGRSEARALGSHLKVLLLHLLKWQFQSAQQSSGWRGSILDQANSCARRWSFCCGVVVEIWRPDRSRAPAAAE